MPYALRNWCLAALCVSQTFTGFAAGATIADVVAATYAPFTVTPPTPDVVVICHGFGCKFRAELALGKADRGKLAQLLARGKGSAAAERAAVAAAGAWFDRRVGPVAGTENHVAAAGVKYMYHPEQFDCIDASRNTTSLLLVLAELHLLRHHTVGVPVSRGLFIDGRPPHTTAVLIENGSGEKWAVDSWTRGYGQPPDVKPLAVWLNE